MLVADFIPRQSSKSESSLDLQHKTVMQSIFPVLSNINIKRSKKSLREKWKPGNICCGSNSGKITKY